MRGMSFILALFFLIALTTPSFAVTDTRAFPPDNCAPRASDPTEMKVIGWQDETASSVCLTAEQALSLAFEKLGCKDGETISTNSDTTSVDTLFCKKL